MLGALGLDHTLRVVLAGCLLLGALAGAVGSFAVLRRQSLLGDALAHAALPGICAGYLLAGTRDMAALLGGALAAGGLAALTISVVARRTPLKTDAALGIVLGVFFAGGVVLLTAIQARGGAGPAGLEVFLFGQAAAMLVEDIRLMAGVGLLAAGLLALFWPWAKVVTFDPDFARSLGLPVDSIRAGLTVLVALVIVVGLQIVGVVLITALLVAPAVAARQWTTRLEAMVALAALLGMLAGLAGALVSATARGLATGPVIVLAASLIVAVSIAAAPGRGLVWRMLAVARARRRLQRRAVLVTMQALGEEHADPGYPVEAGMIRAYHGPGSRRTLARLAQEGLVRPVAHHPETTPHYELTAEGHSTARALRAPQAGGMGQGA